jgi:hypothetical protein
LRRAGRSIREMRQPRDGTPRGLVQRSHVKDGGITFMFA